MSQSNGKWEVGVAVPIENYNFRYRNRFTGTGDLSASATDMTVSSFTTDAGESNLEYIFDPTNFNEYISIKNSSGEVCSKKISSVDNGTDTIVLDSAADSNFQSSGLFLFGYGKSIPGGWYNYILNRGSSGETDNFSVVVDGSGNMIQDLNSSYFFSGQAYRLISVAKKELNLNAASLSVGTALTATRNNDEYGIVFDYGAISSSSDFQEITINRGEISDIGLEFAYNPVVNREISTNGYYEFEDWPSQGSVEWENRAILQSIDKYNSGISLYDVTGEGERNEKLTISASFTNAPLSLFTTLREFLRVQNNGYSLDLHPYGYSELPKIVNGYLTLENVSRGSWNLSLVDFDMTFKEK